MSGETKSARTRGKKRSPKGRAGAVPHQTAITVNGKSLVSSVRPSLNGDGANRSRSKSTVDMDASDLVLWRSPLRVVHYSCLEAGHYCLDWISALLRHKLICLIVAILIGSLVVLHNTPGSHTPQLALIEKYVLWWGWWVSLGILSSVGLGTGLHTFLLYLGPHIAAVTLAAYECQSTDFPEPPYPDQINCPDTTGPGGITVWDILSKVRIEAFLWGAGTAIGELPPYFMARAARLSGSEAGEEEQEFLDLQEKVRSGEKMSMLDTWKYRVQWAVQKVGFLGILLCASIPNPLFDLAGITCGHFLVPFWTFFGATLIGKAVVKMHIQKIFVIFAFNESLLESAMAFLKTVPVLGLKLEAPIRAMLAQQKDKLHRKSGSQDGGGNILSAIFEKFVMAMVVYFVVSIINSLAQSYYKRIHAKKGKD